MNSKGDSQQTLNLPVLILDFLASMPLSNKGLLLSLPVYSILVKAAFPNLYLQPTVLSTDPYFQTPVSICLCKSFRHLKPSTKLNTVYFPVTHSLSTFYSENGIISSHAPREKLWICFFLLLSLPFIH